MAVKVTRISDLETCNRDHQFTGVVANCARTSEEIYEQKGTVIGFPRSWDEAQLTSNHQIHQNHQISSLLLVIPSGCLGILRLFSAHYEMAQGVLLGGWVEMTRTKEDIWQPNQYQ